ncbi:sialidase family protein [Candidatus Nitrosocosmicus hydrocola]|uniref:sialidase family protein n=1 Tax=Candidatus Nitrosocosmicus hydrocola TaxID=1826872 RepID=UPI0011E5D2BF|nr:sialidase family protein [Candidatus Nitrosocosmicus hydrocola]
MFANNIKILGIIVLITTFVFSNSLQHPDKIFATPASNMTNTTTTLSASNSSIPGEGISEMSINNTNSDNIGQIINASLSGATYSVFKNASTPAVAIDPNSGSLYIVFFKNETAGANLYIQKSTDMGKTFSQPVRVNDVKDSIKVEEQWSAPALSVGPNNDIHVVWYKADHSNPDKYPYGQVTIQYSRSLDGGMTFAPAINPAPNDPKGEQSYPFLAVSSDDKVYISYLNLDYDKPTDLSGTPTVLRVVSSQDGGATFANSSIADNSACQCCSTVVKFGPQDDVYVTSRSTFQNHSVALTNDTKTAYQSDSGQNQTIIRDITVSRSTDGPIAQNFTIPVQVGNDRWFMNGCPDAGPGFDFDKTGNIHIAWFTGSEFAPGGPGFYYTTSTDDGATFNKPIPIHLLSEQWIPPTTQYLKTDKYGNSWIVFVNSEGMQKSETYSEDFSFKGHGTVHLAIVDKDGNFIRNGNFASGDITKHYPFTTGSDELMAISWVDGDNVKLATIPIA